MVRSFDSVPPGSGKPEAVDRAPRWSIFPILYLLFVIGFVLLSVLSPETMARQEIPLGGREFSLGGLNVAVVYGLGLVVGVVVVTLHSLRADG